MAYVGPLGIPHSVFLGWSDEDRAKALAWQAHEAERCGGCGQHPGDWTDADGKEAKDPPLWVGTRFCAACEMLHDWRGEEHKPGSHPTWKPPDDE